MANWVRLRRQSHAPRELDGTETIYAAADGTLKHMDPEGSLSDLAGSGSLPSPTSEGDVLTVVSGDWAGAAPGGGSQPGLVSQEVTITEQAANGPTLPITAASSGSGTFTVAGDHTDRFPVDPLNWSAQMCLIVTGSTGNDGVYPVQSVEFTGGNTIITVGSSPADDTADGSIVCPGLYEATVDMPEGAVLDDVRLFNASTEVDGFANWAADQAWLLFIEDSTGVYYKDVELDGTGTTGEAMTARYPVAAEQDTINYTAQRSLGGGMRAFKSDGTKPWEGTWGEGDILSTLLKGTIAVGGGGRRFPTDDTLTIRIIAVSETPPEAATGALIVKVTYWLPVTATEATFS